MITQVRRQDSRITQICEVCARVRDSKLGVRTEASLAVLGSGLTMMIRVSFLENRRVNGLVSASHTLLHVLLSMSMAL